MKRSNVIALAGISAALAYVSIILSFYSNVMTLSLGALAGICLMLPLTCGSIVGALFAYISASILSGITIGFNALTFILFFGPFTIIGYLVDFKLYYKLKLPKWAKIIIGYVIKGIYYSATITALYFIMIAIGNMDNVIEFKYLWVGIMLLVLLFFLYDLLMRLVYINLKNLINNRILKNRGKPVEKNSEKPQNKTSDVDVFGIDEKDEEVESKKTDKADVKENPKVDDSSSRFTHFLEMEEKDKQDKTEK